jgi:hypothetical protein
MTVNYIQMNHSISLINLLGYLLAIAMLCLEPCKEKDNEQIDLMESGASGRALLAGVVLLIMTPKSPQ